MTRERCACGHERRDHDDLDCCERCGCAGYQALRGSRRTVSRTVRPVGEATRALWFDLVKVTEDDPGHDAADLLAVLSEADAADPLAVGDLLYAFRTGQL